MFVFWMGLGLGLALGIGLGWLAGRKAGRSRQSSPPVSQSAFQDLAQRPEALPVLQDRLLQLAEGDRAVADRLVAQARFGKPGRSENYYYWRAIRQLEQSRSPKSS